jgi:hypothetical protein
MGEIVNEFTRFGHIVQAVGSLDAPLFFDHKLTGSRDLGVKRRQLEHTQDTAAHCTRGAPEPLERGMYQPGRAAPSVPNLFGRIAHPKVLT